MINPEAAHSCGRHCHHHKIKLRKAAKSILQKLRENPGGIQVFYDDIYEKRATQTGLCVTTNDRVMGMYTDLDLSADTPDMDTMRYVINVLRTGIANADMTDDKEYYHVALISQIHIINYPVTEPNMPYEYPLGSRVGSTDPSPSNPNTNPLALHAFAVRDSLGISDMTHYIHRFAGTGGTQMPQCSGELRSASYGIKTKKYNTLKPNMDQIAEDMITLIHENGHVWGASHVYGDIFCGNDNMALDNTIMANSPQPDDIYQYMEDNNGCPMSPGNAALTMRRWEEIGDQQREATISAYVDADKDGYGSDQVVQICGLVTGYSDQTGDCDDNDPNVGMPNIKMWLDADGDGEGNPDSLQLVCAGDTLDGYVFNDTDPDDSNAGITPVLETGIDPLKIYPNPTTGMLHISGLAVHHTSVLTLDGTRIAQTKEQSIDLSPYPAGVYFLQIQSDKTIHSKKVIKMH